MKLFTALGGSRQLAKAELMESACFQRHTDGDKTQASVPTFRFYLWIMRDEKKLVPKCLCRSLIYWRAFCQC
jgi:hypothetical protein